MTLHCYKIFSLLILVYGMLSCRPTSTSVGSKSLCPPAISGDEHTFGFEINKSTAEKWTLQWRKDNVTVSTCRNTSHCSVDDTTLRTSINFFTTNSFLYNVTIKKVTYQDAAVWSLSYLSLAGFTEPQYSCTLYVYALPGLSLNDCPNVVEEMISTSCCCNSYNSTDIIGWFDAKGEKVTNNERTISYVAKRQDAGYQCRGSTSNGEKYLPITYNPVVVVKPESVKCETNCSKSYVKIICTIEKIYPQAICHFKIEFNNDCLEHPIALKSEESQTEYMHEYLDSEKLYFKSVCTLTLPSQSKLSDYGIVVNVNPNATGNASDLVYAENKTITVPFKCKVEAENNYRTSDSNHWFIYLATGLLILILATSMTTMVTVLIILCCRTFEVKSNVDETQPLNPRDTHKVDSEHFGEESPDVQNGSKHSAKNRFQQRKKLGSATTNKSKPNNSTKGSKSVIV